MSCYVTERPLFLWMMLQSNSYIGTRFIALLSEVEDFPILRPGHHKIQYAALYLHCRGLAARWRKEAVIYTQPG